jgi:hypothetical protein
MGGDGACAPAGRSRGGVHPGFRCPSGRSVVPAAPEGAIRGAGRRRRGRPAGAEPARVRADLKVASIPANCVRGCRGGLIKTAPKNGRTHGGAPAVVFDLVWPIPTKRRTRPVSGPGRPSCSTLCRPCRQKVERSKRPGWFLLPGGDAQAPRPTTLLTQPRRRPRNHKPAAPRRAARGAGAPAAPPPLARSGRSAYPARAGLGGPRARRGGRGPRARPLKRPTRAPHWTIRLRRATPGRPGPGPRAKTRANRKRLR